MYILIFYLAYRLLMNGMSSHMYKILQAMNTFLSAKLMTWQANDNEEININSKQLKLFPLCLREYHSKAIQRN